MENAAEDAPVGCFVSQVAHAAELLDRAIERAQADGVIADSAKLKRAKRALEHGLEQLADSVTRI